MQGSIVESEMVESFKNIEVLFQVGATRAMRFRRDTDIRTIADIANADLEELQQVWSIGPVRAAQIKGSAQGWMSKNADVARKARREIVSDSMNDVATPGRERTNTVFLCAGDDVLRMLDSDSSDIDDVNAFIDDALELAGVDVDENTQVGFVSNGELGGNYISAWHGRLWGRNPDVPRQQFNTPWTKYARWLDKMRFVDDEFIAKHDIDDVSEVPDGRLPETPDPVSDTPLDSVVSDDDVFWGLAGIERNEEIIEWASEVVILCDGPKMDYLRESCKYSNTDCTTVFEIANENVVSLGKYTPDPDITTYTPDEDEQVSGGQGTTAGRNPKPDDEVLHSNSEVEDEQSRIDDETAGGGVGSKSYDVL